MDKQTVKRGEGTMHCDKNGKYIFRVCYIDVDNKKKRKSFGGKDPDDRSAGGKPESAESPVEAKPDDPAASAVQEIIPDASDPDTLANALALLPAREPIDTLPPRLGVPERVLPPREAMLAPFETLPREQCLGRVLAAPTVSCPPAVPILVCGERIDAQALALFAYYGLDRLDVVLPEWEKEALADV